MQVYVERQARWKGIRWTCRDRWCCEGPPTLSAPLHRVHQAERAGSGVRDAAGRGRAAAGGCQSISRRSPGPVLPSSRPFQVNHSVLYGESHVTIRQALSRAVHSGAPVTLVVARRTQHVNVFQPTSEKSLPASYPLLASGHEKIVKVSPVCRHSAIHWDVYGFQAKSEVNLPDIVNNTDALLHQVSRRLRARSLEPLTGLAIWNCVPLVVCLQKDERGLGFSIVDYQVSCALCFVHTLLGPNCKSLFPRADSFSIQFLIFTSCWYSLTPWFCAFLFFAFWIFTFLLRSHIFRISWWLPFVVSFPYLYLSFCLSFFSISLRIATLRESYLEPLTSFLRLSRSFPCFFFPFL